MIFMYLLDGQLNDQSKLRALLSKLFIKFQMDILLNEISVKMNTKLIPDLKIFLNHRIKLEELRNA